jgi:Leucine-rich repeat (LRR) protein
MNQLDSLPKSICELTELQALYLHNNNFTNFPESICRLDNLNTITMSDNKLFVLPESIGVLINLNKLILNSNLLTFLPESIGKLVNLKCLNLENNRLNYISRSIANIKESLVIHKSTYEIDNLSVNTEFLIFTDLTEELTNLPTGLKELWIKSGKKNLNHKLPFGCVIEYF